MRKFDILANDYKGTRDISRNALSAVFEALLKSNDRKTLLLVDKHRSCLGETLHTAPVRLAGFSIIVSLVGRRHQRVSSDFRGHFARQM